MGGGKLGCLSVKVDPTGQGIVKDEEEIIVEETHRIPKLKLEALGDLDGDGEEERLVGGELGHQVDEEEPTRQELNDIVKNLNDISENDEMEEGDKMIQYDRLMHEYIADKYTSVGDLATHPITERWKG